MLSINSLHIIFVSEAMITITSVLTTNPITYITADGHQLSRLCRNLPAKP